LPIFDNQSYSSRLTGIFLCDHWRSNWVLQRLESIEKPMG